MDSKTQKEAIDRFKNDDTHLPKDALMSELAKRIQNNPRTALQIFSGMKENETEKLLTKMNVYFKEEGLDSKKLDELKNLLEK